MRDRSPQGPRAESRRRSAPGRATRATLTGRAGWPRRALDKEASRGGGGAGWEAGERSPRGLTFAAALLRSSWSRRAPSSSRRQALSRGPMVAAPGAAGDQQRRRGSAARLPGAAASNSVSEGPSVSPAHRPGRGGSEQRPERAARGAPQFVGAAPSPRQRAGGVSKGRTLRRG